MSGIKISIITATLNCESTIKDCLASVAAQTFNNREHIIVDGASTDDTFNLLQENSDKFSKLISEPDQGIYFALNKGLRLATGDVVGFLHADDFYAHPHVLNNIAEAFIDPTVCAVFGDLQYISRYDTRKVVRQWVGGPFTTRSIARGWMPPHPTLYVRRTYYEKIGGFDTKYQIAADYDSVLQLFKLNDFKPKYLPGTMVKMRLGGVSNRSMKNIFLKSIEDYQVLRKSNSGIVGSFIILLYKNIIKFRQFQFKLN